VTPKVLHLAFDVTFKLTSEWLVIAHDRVILLPVPVR
jgi:hypothetical protein